MRTIISLIVVTVISLSIITISTAQEIDIAGNVTGLKDRIGLGLTVYKGNFALVRDTRSIQFNDGLSRLAMADIAALIQPQTARLQADGVTVLEQYFDYDLLSPSSLLKRHIGRMVGLARSHPASGQDLIEEGRLLAVTDGQAVFKIKDRIETVSPNSPYRFVFQDIPTDLRERPTLSMLVESKGGKKKAELTYLTNGLNWSADYLATLSPDGQSMDLKSWLTLTNTSGTSYRKADLQLMAGDVGRVDMKPILLESRLQVKSSTQPVREKLFEYHLYNVPRPVDIADEQTKQIELLSARTVKIATEYVIDSTLDRRFIRPANFSNPLKVRTRIGFVNAKPDLGLPLPAGIVRLHKQDKKGRIQFIGEDRIRHTPQGQSLSLQMGNAFDLSATRTMTDFKKIYGTEIKTGYSITIHNAKDVSAKVKVIERIHGDWSVSEETTGHVKKSATMAVWSINVPAMGSNTLSYKVHIK